ncbi:uncharacterized protein LOC119735171 [Patiria miniata]|uniref:Netrin receptor UNC5 n=1 Tax=Patiria miniata TaxID=46514 RepID=A0A914AMZ7_PATMI|nr:uncharacterized protein LOC119735171 [Patiria miniata]
MCQRQRKLNIHRDVAKAAKEQRELIAIEPNEAAANAVQEQIELSVIGPHGEAHEHALHRIELSAIGPKDASQRLVHVQIEVSPGEQKDAPQDEVQDQTQSHRMQLKNLYETKQMYLGSRHGGSTQELEPGQEDLSVIRKKNGAKEPEQETARLSAIGPKDASQELIHVQIGLSAIRPQDAAQEHVQDQIELSVIGQKDAAQEPGEEKMELSSDGHGGSNDTLPPINESISPIREASCKIPPVEISPVLQPAPGGASNCQGSSSAPPTLLKRILDEHDNFAKECSEDTLMDNTFQLPYIAIGYFDHDGGSLSLGKYNVHMYIPRGALPKKSLQQVYIYVNPNAPPVDGIHPPQVALSPVIQCGPPGLKFLDSVVLQFPHHASENSSWMLYTKICSDEDAAYKAWHPLDGEEDGIVVSTENKKVVLLMKHFTGAALVGEPSSTSSKMVHVGAFGGSCTESDTSYAVRIHAWDDDPVAKQKVLDMEKELESKPLDVYRDMLVHHSHGGVIVALENLKTGWELEENTSQKQEISKSRVWRFPKNSVTFDMRRQLPRAESDLMQLLPGADGVIYQCISESDTTSTEDRIRLSIRPKQGKIATSHKEASKTCTEEKVRTAITRRVHGLMDGDYGGFSEALVQKLCQHLDTEKQPQLDGTCPGPTWGRSSVKRHRSSRKSIKGDDQSMEKTGVITEASGSVQRVSEIPLRSAPGSNSDVSGSIPCQISTEVDDQKRLRRLAEKLGPEWETLATELGCTSENLFRIKEDKRNCVVNQIFTMLVEWRQRGGRLDESILADALGKAKRFDLAQQFREMTSGIRRRRVSSISGRSISGCSISGRSISRLSINLQ